MGFFIILLLVVAVGSIAWLKLRAAGALPAVTTIIGRLVDQRAVGQPGELGPLIASLYQSLIHRSRRTWWTRRHHIDGQAWRVVAAPQDARVLAQELPAVEADLDAALRANAGKHRIVIGAPLQLLCVDMDPDVTPGRPALEPADGAPAPQRPVRQEGAPMRTNHGRSWEAPTSLANTAGEGVIAGPAPVVRLWPLGSFLHGGPINVPVGGLVLGRSQGLGAGRLATPTVSGRHAELRPESDGWIIRDLGSTNGVWVHGRRVAEAPLRHGDVVSLGRKMRLRLVVGDEALAPTSGVAPEQGGATR